MVTMKKLMMLMVAAIILFCSHQQAVMAREVAVAVVDDDGKDLEIFPWDIPCYLPWPFPWPRPYPCPPPRPRPRPCPPPPPPCSPPPPPRRLSPPPPPPRSPPPTPFSGCSTSDKEKVKKCMFNTTSIDACCPTFQSILGTSCPCYKYAEDLDNQILITLEAYCDVDSPCRGVPSPPPPRPTPFAGCLAGDKDKVKMCMFNTTSIDECCPTFKSTIGTNCDCYKYAEDLDNQVLITLEAYCDVDSPCRSVQSLLPPRPIPFANCSASDKDKIKMCMLNTTSLAECCPTFKSTIGTNCDCYKYAENLDNQELITLEAYCDVDSPCRSVQSLLPPRPIPFANCSASDKDKIKMCMFNTTSLAECCPTFESTIGTNCDCYKYAENLDNQELITLEAYCDVDSPCRSVQSLLPPRPIPFANCSASDKDKIKICMFNTTLLAECCPTFESTIGTNCDCYKYAENLDNQELITLEAYCDVDSPCRSVQSLLPPRPIPFANCSASDKDKIKMCMFNTTSLAECCPTFESTISTNCDCYKYAENLDNQELITLEAYCDVDSPCRSVQSLLPPRPIPFANCSASDKDKIKICMFNTTLLAECCPTFESTIGTNCDCYKYAENLDNQELITLEAYCDVDSPCRSVQSLLPPRLIPFANCSASDKDKIKMCMFNTTSLAECCPTFESTIGTNCDCYKYAENLDNQELITLKAFCGVDSPCRSMQVIKLSKDDE